MNNLNTEQKIDFLRESNHISGVERVIAERFKQIYENSYTNLNHYKQREAYDRGQLVYAARILSKLSPSRLDLCPINWEGNQAQWLKLLSKPYEERLIIASTFLMAQVEYIEFKKAMDSNNDQPNSGKG